MKNEKLKIKNGEFIIMKNFKTKVVILFLFICAIANSAPLKNVPIEISQPNGTIINCYASGDEFYNWAHDGDGYTIKQDEQGWYCYAVRSGDTLIASQFIVGSINPSKITEPWIKISGELIRKKALEYRSRISPKNKNIQVNATKSNNGLMAPTTGVFNNIVIYIRFAGENEFTDSSVTVDRMFNATTGNSMKSYFQEASYNKLNTTTTFYPISQTWNVVSYQDTFPRSYYQPYSTSNTNGYTSSNSTDREHSLLKRAVEAVRSQIPPTLNVDADNDGYVDNVCFVVSGSVGAWADLLWPHMWSLYTYNVTINGKTIDNYNFQLRNSMFSSGVGVLCHEMFHSLGSPDLYHYSYDGLTPVGAWDIMEYDQDPPQHMGAYMKFKYGKWIDSIPTITNSGTYSLKPLTSSTNNCYKILTPNSTSQYYVLEYRRNIGTFESSLPGSGLIIYRINTLYGGNADGPPDEVYAYRPNGTLTVSGSYSSANYSSNVGRTSISPITIPFGFLADGSDGGLNIRSIGSADTSISFYVDFSQILYPPKLATPTNGQASVATNQALTWTSVQNAVNYRVQLAKDTNFTNYEINQVTNSKSLNFNFSPFTKYFVRLKTYSASDSSAWSSVYSFTTSANKEVNLSKFIFQSSVGTYTKLSGFTNSSLLGDDSSKGVKMPFAIKFGSTYYDTLSLCSNGWIGLGYTKDSTYVNTLLNTSNTVAKPNPKLCPLWDDFKVDTLGQVKYKTTGVSPNRIFTVEYSYILRWSSTAKFNYQVNLYEGSNIIEYLYGPKLNVSSATNLSASIGMVGRGGGTKNIISITKTNPVTVSDTLANDTLAAVSLNSIAQGAIYRFIPIETALAPNLIYPANNTSNIAYNPALIWNKNSYVSSYQLNFSSDSLFSNLLINERLSDTLKVLTNLIKNTKYYWRVKGYNSSDSSAWSQTFSFTTINDAYNFSGNIKYKNSVSSPINGAKISLYLDTNVVATSIADSNGVYHFDMIPNNNYTAKITSSKAWGGMNIQDVALIRMFAGQVLSFDSLQIKASNFNMDYRNGKPYVNIQDVAVMRMKNGGVYTPLWILPDWVFTIETAPSVYQYDLGILINGANQIINFRGLCSGDLNGSYTPPK